MNKKKILSLVMSIVMTGTLLASCGGGTQNASTDEDVTVISLWVNNSHSKSVMDELVNEWNNTTGKEKGIKIDYVVKGNIKYKRLLNQLRSRKILREEFA